MKIILLKNNIKNGLDTVGRSIGSNLNLPVLGGVLINASNNQIKLSTTNLELAITKNIFGKVVEEGSVVVPYNTLASTVSNITSERIHIEKTKQGNTELKTDNYTATIQGVSEKEFPIIPKIDKKHSKIEIETQTLIDSLSKVVIAGEVSDLRPEIGGVLFAGETTALKLAATDSFRLAEAKIIGDQARSSTKEPFKATVPLKTTQEVIRVINEDTTNLYFEDNQVLFETENTSIISRLIEGTFPDYSSIIPQKTDTNILLKREELINALKLASSFVSKTNDVKIAVKDKKVIEVYSGDNSIGENKYLIPAKIDGPGMEIVFNWKYLLDGVRTGTSKDVFIGLSGSDKPALIKEPNDDSYFYILMPINP